MAVQLREVTGYSRNDAAVQKLRRELALDPSRWPEIEAIEIRQGEWQTVAIETWDAKAPAGEEWRAVFFPWEGRHFGERHFGDWVATRLHKLPEPWWESRDYETFARLAGVRNYHDAQPISAPRGLPLDWDMPDFGEDSWISELGDHSHSWLLASEILAYRWQDEREWPVVDMAQAWADRFGADGVRFVFGFDS